MTKQIRVLVVDDSVTARQLMRYVINQTTDMVLVGEAANGHEAIRLAEQLRPDIIVMDITMPQMDGLEATRIIMHEFPAPIVIVSASIAGRETEIAFQALRMGALTVMPKPGAQQPHEINNLLNTLRAMADVRVIHHRWNQTSKASAPGKASAPAATPTPIESPAISPELLAIVSSTGGPAALSSILKILPREFPLPIAIVQHIAPDFLPSLVEWLDGVSPMRVRIAEHRETPLPGTVYFAPGNKHLTLDRAKRFDCSYQRETRHIPSGDVLLESVAQAYGPRAIGVVLTGMGDDGARGLLQMHQAGATTIAQDQETSVVYGMPQEAANMNAARHILALPEIPNILLQLTRK